MASLNLRAFTVLVVDQDDAHRWMLHNVLTALGVGEVLTATTNEDALALLKRLSKKNVGERIDTVDLVICEAFSKPLDGTSLVRWVRMHADSPNRFLPVILMANTFEPSDIAQARGYGATHFLMKPVTVETLMDRMLTVINRPRQFVYVSGYFGPDRRGPQKSVDADRRDIERNDVHVVRLPLTQALEHFPTDHLIRYFRPPNHLKRKAGNQGDEDSLFTAGAMAKASREFDKAQADYADQSMDYVDSLKRILGEAHSAADKSEHLARIHALARQLGLQGETFGYPLVTTVGNSLVRFTGDNVRITEASLELVKVHIDALTVILRNRVAGDGGATGRELVSQLQAAIRKITAQTAHA